MVVMGEDDDKRPEVAKENTMESQGDKETTTTGSGSGSSKKKATPRKFLTRAGAAVRRKQEQTVGTQITVMEQDLNPANIEMHELLLRRALATLEHLHMEYMGKNGMNPNLEPEKSYMDPFRSKVTRAVARHKSLDGIDLIKKLGHLN